MFNEIKVLISRDIGYHNELSREEFDIKFGKKYPIFKKPSHFLKINGCKLQMSLKLAHTFRGKIFRCDYNGTFELRKLIIKGDEVFLELKESHQAKQEVLYLKLESESLLKRFEGFNKKKRISKLTKGLFYTLDLFHILLLSSVLCPVTSILYLYEIS